MKIAIELLLVWIFIPPILLTIFQRGALDQLFVGIAPAVIVAVAMLFSKRKVLIVFLVLLNILQVWRNFPTNTNVFFQAPQPDVRYSDQLNVVREISRRAGDRLFEVQAYTIPYFWQDAWIYLFWWTGKTPVPTGGDVMYVILQHDDSTFQKNWYRDVVSTWGTRIDQFTIGSFTVEERLL